MIIFEKIRYKNIMSVGESAIEIDLNSHQTSLIVGRNGAGKSTVLEALSFVLYGKPFRKLTKGQMINNVNGKGLLVEIWFVSNGKKYHIRRGMKPNIFEVFENGVKWNEESTSSIMQSELESKVLKMSQKTFSQNAVLGVTSYVPFMLMDAASRRKFVEDLLDLDIFRKMADIVKTKAIENKNLLSRANTDLEVVNARIDGVNDKIRALQTQSFNHIQGLKDLLKEELENSENIEKRIEEYQNEYNDLNSKVDQELRNRDFNKEVAELNSSIKVLSMSTSSQEKEIDHLKHTEICNSCGQNIDEDFRKNKIASILEEIGNAINHKKQLEQNLEKIISEKTNLETLLVPINEAHKKLEMEKTSLAFSRMKIKDIASQIKKKSEEKFEEINEEELDSLKSKRNLIQGALTNLQKQKEVILAASTLLKDDGIKATVIEQYVPIINKMIQDYLNKFELFVNFSLDNTFQETITSSNASEFSYESFSEGERLRINVSILLTWREIAKMRNSAATNLLILDEILDSSMDVDGTMILIDALKEMHQDDSIIVISHKGDGLDERFDRVIRMNKIKGFTQMEEIG